jgi:hypothetical protein
MGCPEEIFPAGLSIFFASHVLPGLLTRKRAEPLRSALPSLVLHPCLLSDRRKKDGLLAHQVFMNRIGGLSTSAHGEDDRGGSGDNVSPRPDAWFAGLARFEIGDDIASFV